MWSNVPCRRFGIGSWGLSGIWDLGFCFRQLLWCGMDLSENLNTIRSRVAAACERAGRSAESVTLLAVTKTHPPEVIAHAARLGLKIFGENKVQEAKAKIPQCPGHLRWHMIGHLQSNKCRDAVALF